MKKSKQDKQLEQLLFEVYDKGVKQQDCNLTECIENVKQSLCMHDVSVRSEQLVNFLLHLNDKKLINNHDFDYEKEAKKYLKN
mgnify:CR=1 FL=1